MLDFLSGIAYLLVILTVLVVVHEWGHFIVARIFKMRVEDFSLFFGPVLWRIGKRGDTEYNIRTVPLGGFVRIAGMEPDDISGGRPVLEAIRHRHHHATGEDSLEASIRELDTDTMAGIEASNVSPSVRALAHEAVGADGRLTLQGREDLEALTHSPQITTDDHKLIQLLLGADTRAADEGLYSQKPIYQRALVIFAGPFMSLFFGYFLFCIMGMTIGLPSGERTNQIAQVMPDGAGRAAGLMTGDRIVSINGTPTTDGKVMTDLIHQSASVPLTLSIQRGDQSVEIHATPRPTKVTYEKDGKKVTETWGMLGVVPNVVFERRGLVASVAAGTIVTREYVTQLLSMVFSRQVKEAVGGPIAMGQMATAVQKLGMAHMLSMAASISLSVGILNLLPIPVLDGGHLLLLAVEKVRRRKLSPREVYRAQMVGLGLLALIVTFVMYNDISRTLMGKSFQ